MRFTMPVLFPSQLLVFLRFLGYFFSHAYDKMAWNRLYVVCEEYVTNYFKYGRKDLLQGFCWFCIDVRQKQVCCMFSDAGKPFNPEKYADKSPGLCLVTSLLHNRYRWYRHRNYFCIKLVV